MMHGQRNIKLTSNVFVTSITCLRTEGNYLLHLV